jgi:hypothetical protein
MENNDLPETTELIQKLLQSFADSKGITNFGYIVATYEKTPSGGYFVGSGISTDTSEHTTDLTEALKNMFIQLGGGKFDQEDPRTPDQVRDDRNLGLN